MGCARMQLQLPHPFDSYPLPLAPADIVYRRHGDVDGEGAESHQHRHHHDEPHVGRHPSAHVTHPAAYPVGDVIEPFPHSSHTRLPFHCPQVTVLQYGELLHREAVRVVVRTHRVQKAAAGDKAPFGDVAAPDERLPRVAGDDIGIAVEVARHAVHLHGLVDVRRDDAVVVSLFLPVLVVAEGALVAQVQCPAYVALDGGLVGREREEQFVKPPHVLPRLDRPVLRQVLREREDERLAVVQHVDFLPLLLGKAVRTPQRIARDQRAQHDKGYRHRANLPEARFDVF